jgi:hypothetical protein
MKTNSNNTQVAVTSGADAVVACAMPWEVHFTVTHSESPDLFHQMALNFSYNTGYGRLFGNNHHTQNNMLTPAQLQCMTLSLGRLIRRSTKSKMRFMNLPSVLSPMCGKESGELNTKVSGTCYEQLCGSGTWFIYPDESQDWTSTATPPPVTSTLKPLKMRLHTGDLLLINEEFWVCKCAAKSEESVGELYLTSSRAFVL